MISIPVKITVLQDLQETIRSCTIKSGSFDGNTKMKISQREL
jgi:hypothetical protein